MSVEQNKAVIKRIVKEVFNENNLAVIDELVTPDWRFHGPMGSEYQGVAGFRKMMADLRASAPDRQVSLLDIVAEGDKVFHRWSMEGNYTVQNQGTPIVSKHLSMMVFLFSHFLNGRESEVWEVYDSAAVMQQLGLLPQTTASGR
jgi:predicted ester cyclase